MYYDYFLDYFFNQTCFKLDIKCAILTEKQQRERIYILYINIIKGIKHYITPGFKKS